VALIYAMGDNGVMFGIVLIAALLVIAVLAPFYGTDSRVDDVARRRLGH
jgi:hypothetical protein